MHPATISVSAWTGSDIQSGIDQVQLFVVIEAVDDIVRFHFYIHPDAGHKRINLNEM
jgi:hypothetical protein